MSKVQTRMILLKFRLKREIKEARKLEAHKAMINKIKTENDVLNGKIKQENTEKPSVRIGIEPEQNKSCGAINMDIIKEEIEIDSNICNLCPFSAANKGLLTQHLIQKHMEIVP